MRVSVLLVCSILAVAIAGIAAAVTSLPEEMPELSFVPIEPDAIELEAATDVQFPIIIAHFGGQVPIVVGASERPQFLYLHAHEPTVWRLHLMPGANVRRIYAYSGFHQSFHISHVDRQPQVIPPIIDLNEVDVEAGIPNFHIIGGVSNDPDRRKAANASLVRAVRLASGGYPPTHIFQHRHLRSREAMLVGVSSDELQWLSDTRHVLAMPDRGSIATVNGEFIRARRDLEPMIRSGILNIAMPDFDGAFTVKGPLVYNDHPCEDVLTGGPTADKLVCTSLDGTRSPPPWIVAGEADDIIGFLWDQDTVIVPGPGDDLLVPDVGNHVIYLSKGWGHDQVWSRCFEERSSMTFVIGSDIDPADIEWVSDQLMRDRTTGDSLRFVHGRCGTFMTPDGTILPTLFEPRTVVAPPPIVTGPHLARPRVSNVRRMPRRTDRIDEDVGVVVAPPPIVSRRSLPPPVPPPAVARPPASEWPGDRSPPQ